MCYNKRKGETTIKENLTKYPNKFLPCNNFEIYSALECYIESFLNKIPAKEYDDASMILEDMVKQFKNILDLSYYDDFNHFFQYETILEKEFLLTKDNEKELILESILVYLPIYFFEKRNNKIILKNHYIDKCLFETEEICYYIIKFINHLSKESKFGQIFTMQDLYDSFCKQEHQKEIHQLKQFITITDKYYNKIKDGNNIEDLLEKLFISFEHEIPYEIEKDAIICAYVKTNTLTNNPKVLNRLKELKQRNS